MATAKKSAKKATKKAAAKKTSAKKASKKAAPSKNAVAKKATKKTTAKKAAAKKTLAKKAAPSKKATAKKVTAKKAARSKKATSKKTTQKPNVKSPFGKKFIDQMKARLIEERAKYLHSEETYRAEADALIEGREPGDVQFDEESGEGDTLAVERERDIALSNQARAAVEQIDAALARVEAGTYGVCVVSGKPIPQDRLKAIPWAAERVEYKVGGLGRR